ncbi:MAG: 3-oxoacyl-ACP synthase III family protein [Fimbriimonas sp.]
MPTYASIGPIAHCFPKAALDNDQLAALYEGWTAEKILQKTGIANRFYVEGDECASDLVVRAAEELFASGVSRDEIDFVLFCTQSPDYFLPTTACVIQERLKLRTDIGALDFNLGCSGFIYGLGLAKALIETGQAKNVLLLTGDTYTRFIHPGDKSVRTLFGDAGAATLVQGIEAEHPPIGPFAYGTDGRGAENLIVPTGGVREARSEASRAEATDESGNTRSRDNLYMNGAEIFNFTLRTVPESLKGLLEKSGHSLEEIDLFVFHQANQYMLEHLRKKVGIPKEKFVIAMRDCGNTVSATIPLALEAARENGQAKPGMLALLLGFGVGYSWGGTLVRL